MKRKEKKKSIFRVGINFLSYATSAWNPKTGIVTRALIIEVSL